MTKIILLVILLHLIIGFGYMLYLLSPRKGDVQGTEPTESEL